MSLKGNVGNLIRRSKRDDSYSVDDGISTTALVRYLAQRFMMALRGLLQKPFFGSSSGMMFIGRRVIIRHKSLIQTGSNLTIKDGAMIDALSNKGIVFGDNVAVGKNAVIECTGVLRNLGEGLRVGSNSNIGDFSFIAVRGPIEIGENVLMGPRVNMHAENHVSIDPKLPIKEQGESRAGIVVENNCWIGAASVILDGVRIGKGAIVGAGSVVSKDVPPFTIVGGVPARKIRSRLER